MLSALPDSFFLWVALAVLLFWFVGAYNRIVRLRSAALQAYAALDAALVRQLEFVQLRSVEATPDEDVYAVNSLRAAAQQLSTLLAATRQRPLDPSGMAALATALHVMLSAWQGLHPDAVVSFEADGTLSTPGALGGRHEPREAPPPMAWPEPSAAAEIARNHFNTSVLQYNAAIGQFPALLVAWIMQLRPAAPLT